MNHFVKLFKYLQDHRNVEVPQLWRWVGFLGHGSAGGRYPGAFAVLQTEALAPGAQGFWGAKFVTSDECDYSDLFIFRFEAGN